MKSMGPIWNIMELYTIWFALPAYNSGGASTPKKHCGPLELHLADTAVNTPRDPVEPPGQGPSLFSF